MTEIIIVVLLLIPLILIGCRAVSADIPENTQVKVDKNTVLEKATLAGGCFWCLEGPFEKLPGVVEVSAGYTGGHTKNPTYEAVCTGTTGHYEAVQISYDPSKITYEKLLDTFWRQIDPTDPDGQFADRGSQYETAIFYHNDEQKKAEKNQRRNLINQVYIRSLL